MSSRKFKAKVVPDTAGRAKYRVYRIEFPILLSVGDGHFTRFRCQWDTGAEFSMLSEKIARDLGIDLAPEPDSEVGGLTGTAAAWFVRRWVRFPGIDGLQFKLSFLVQQHSALSLPLFGMRDTYENFEVLSHGPAYYFFLADRHTGELLPADDDRPS